MRIAYLIDSIETDKEGTQKQLLELIRRLEASGVTPVLICLRTSDWLRNNPLSCPTYVLGYSGLLKPSLPRVIVRLARVLRTEKIQLLQTFFEDSIFVAYLASFITPRGVRFLSSRRDIGLGSQIRPWYHRLFAAVLPIVNWRFAAIVANSREVAAWAERRERIPASKLRVHYNGVHLPPATAPSALPSLMAQPEDTLWVCISASLTIVKRHDVFLRAFRKLLDGNPGRVRAILLGDGPLRDELQALARELGITDHTVFAGSVADVRPYLEHAHIAVLCSDKEGLSNAILEYMANRLPVVATSVGGNRELIDDSVGRLVPPNDPDALAAALQVFVADESLRRRCGSAGRARVEERFSWNRSIARIVADYDAIAVTSSASAPAPGR